MLSESSGLLVCAAKMFLVFSQSVVAGAVFFFISVLGRQNQSRIHNKN